MATTPSLALIPSGYKALRLYSVLPADGTGDFDFTRSGSATRVNKEGLIETVGSNVPRLNYPLIDGVVSGCPSLLLEPARTNLIQYSEDFSDAYWTKSGSSVTSGFISPDGTANAFKLVEGNGAAQHRIITSINVTSGLKYTESVFVKDFSGNRKIQLNNDGAGINSYFDLTTLAITNISGVGKYTAMADGWYKFEVTGTAISTGIANTYIALANPTETYTGDGTSGVYLFGAQLEEGSYATSYIPTSGSTATRTLETCNNAGDVNTFNDSEGVLFAEISALDNSNTFRAISISDGTNDNRVVIDYNQSNQIRGLLAIGGNTTNRLITDTSTDIKQVNKIAFKYRDGDIALWVNGIEIGTTSGSNTLPANTLNRLNFDFGNGLDGYFYGNTKQIQYFNTALNDTSLETLTSWRSFNEMATAQLYTIL